MTEMLDRASVPSLLAATRIVAVLRAASADHYDAVVDVLVSNGVRSIELTLTTPGTLEKVPGIVRRVGDSADIGVGTITSPVQAVKAIDQGARYLVTPITLPEVVTVAVYAGVPIFPGALTPTEVFAAWSAGATAVKIFPAQAVGADYGSHLLGPFPDLAYIPSGGIGELDVEEWLRAGAVAVSVGSPLLGDALRGGSLKALAERAARFRAIAEQFASDQ